MCGIAGFFNTNKHTINDGVQILDKFSSILAHRGPDGSGKWLNSSNSVGLAHRRLSIIDLTKSASQPMRTNNGCALTYNGEIYNYKELQDKLKHRWSFRTSSDTECILATYEAYGVDSLQELRGMFAFALWDDKNQRLFCARDRFGIKPFYYCVLNDIFYFASEAKALLPLLDEIRTNKTALAEYLTFQYTIGEKTLFSGIRQLLPGHYILIENGEISIKRYWDINYEIDFDHSASYFQRHLETLLEDSISIHGRSDVPVGAYISGGIDSSLMYRLATKNASNAGLGFHGRFMEYPGYDESGYALEAVQDTDGILHNIDITHLDFSEYLEKVIYHLDFPVAGPGAFPQYMVSKLAAEHVKVVLGGQGGDEIFGGYTRYVIAYLEQCIRAAIDGEYKNGNYVVTIESIIPNLGLLREYKPLMKEFWRDGLFAPMDERYFRLVNRSNDMQEEIHWEDLDMRSVFEDFQTIFNNPSNVKKEAYFDKMTHFDFKCLIPALLQVEDRMSMAHGLESRVPLLDHPLVEFAATIPADIKFKGGQMKYLIKQVFGHKLPSSIVNRRDKMGFPVPLKEWFDGPLNEFVMDTLSQMKSKNRDYINVDAVFKNFEKTGRYSRKIWALLSLEIWHQQFHDEAIKWKNCTK